MKKFSMKKKILKKIFKKLKKKMQNQKIELNLQNKFELILMKKLKNKQII